MEWSDDAIVLSARRHGESALVAHVLTRGRGRRAGLVPGGAGKRRRGLWQPGNRVRCLWRGRLAEHLGRLAAEPLRAGAALLFDDPARLAALSGACAMCDAVLPEGAPHPALFRGLAALLDALEAPGAETEIWAAAYVAWEVGLLAELGFALDLERCAATGSRDDLRWVSPRTGRAVSGAAGAPFAGRLLPLPGFLAARGGEPDMESVLAGLRLTEHFLARHALAGAALPPARARLERRLARHDGDRARAVRGDAASRK